MKYYIHEWFDTLENGTACVYRTDSLEEWLKKIAELSKKYKFNEKNCRWVKHHKGQDEWTIFSYPTNATVFNPWKELRYTFKPDFIFYGKPEGVRYYE